MRVDPLHPDDLAFQGDGFRGVELGGKRVVSGRGRRYGRDEQGSEQGTEATGHAFSPGHLARAAARSSSRAFSRMLRSP